MHMLNLIARGSLIWLIGHGSVNAQSAADLASEMFEKAAAAPSVPGINVAVADESGIIWAEGFGYANLEYMIPMTPKTKMRIGSVAKVITSAALMKLYEQGKIDLDGDIRENLPQWPPHHAAINLRQLANHTAGIRHYAGNEFAGNVQYKDSVEALWIFKNSPLLFVPGSQYSYSTYGWTVISAVMEAVSAGKNFKQIIRDEVLTPLNMNNTTFDDSAPLIENRQGAYNFVDGKLVNTPAVNSSYKYAGGGFLATPSDVVTFAMAHAKPGFLKANTLKMIFEKTAPSPHGIGWVVGYDQNQQTFLRGEEDQLAMMDIIKEHPHTVMHSGGSTGALTMMILCLDHNRAVTLTKNVGNESTANHFALALKTLDIFHKNN